MIDFRIGGGGSVFTLQPNTKRAREWIEENLVVEPWQWLGDAVAIEHRFIGNITEGIKADGLTLS